MKRVAIVLAEILAIAMLRALYIHRRDSVLPKGSKVQRIRNRPVYRFPFLGKRKGGPRERFRKVRREDGGSAEPSRLNPSHGEDIPR